MREVSLNNYNLMRYKNIWVGRVAYINLYDGF